MPQPISSVVKVAVVYGVRTITQAGFGTPLLIAEAASFNGIRSYSDIDDVGTDFQSTSNEYLAAERLFSAAVKPSVIKIGNAGPPPLTMFGNSSWKALLDSTVWAIGKTFTITVDAFTATHTVSYGEQLNDTILAIEGQLRTQFTTGFNFGSQNPNEIDVVTIDGNQHAVSASTGFTVTNSLSTAPSINGGGQGAAVTPLAALQSFCTQDLDFYGVMMISRDDAMAFQIAEFIETQRKIFVYSSMDPEQYDPASTTDFMAKVKAAGLTRTVPLFSGSSDIYPEGSWLSDELPRDPGSYTEKFKTLVGVAPDDTLTTTQIAAIKAKNGNTYTTVGGTPIIAEGTVANGEFIDVVRFIDWLQAQIEENCYSALVSVPKIPMTNKGIGVIEGQLRFALDAGVRVGGLVEGYTVTVPDISQISVQDRAKRNVPGIKFDATLAGAIHFANIAGTVGV